MKKMTFILFLFITTIPLAQGADKMFNTPPQLQYSMQMSAKASLCTTFLNEMTLFGNGDSPTGAFASGQNLTGYLQNGANELKLLGGPLGFFERNYDVDPRFECQMRVNKITTKGEEELTQLKLHYDVDAVKQNQISGLLSSKYKGEGSIGAVKETYLKNIHGVKLSQIIHIEGLPTWKWATATPYTGTHAQTMLLREAYRNLMDALSDPTQEKERRAIYQVASEELGWLNGLTPEGQYNSLDIERDLANGYKVVQPDWSEFKVVSYLGGRLLRYENKNDSSPIKLKNEKGQTFRLGPFFSIINGKAVLTR